IEDRRPVDAGDAPHRWLQNRLIRSEPVELTSRESTHRIKDYKEQLALPISHERRVDVCLASNMIAVGVDIDRLGLMVVAGQPKSTSEYIQCSSRVGRDASRPGLVVTVYNLAKPRDRSHYEHFAAYHEGFYRRVESQSLTPFSEPALDRGLAGALVGLARHSSSALCPAEGVMAIAQEMNGGAATEAVAALKARARQHGDDTAALSKIVEQRAEHLVEKWHAQVKDATAEYTYSRYDRKKKGKKLLSPLGDKRSDDDAPDFPAPTSMRDVEPSVHLWMFRSSAKANDPDAAPTGAASEEEG
ncbi:MAG: helicase, partial [Myxococcales bacterium]|nr:helicase [Myxococcales bacterium]